MNLKSGRKQIDNIDKAIINLLKNRINIAKKLLPFKKSITDKSREKVVLNQAKEFKEIFKAIIKETKKRLK